MFTISNEITNEIIIKNSKFITVIKKITKKEDFDNILEAVKIKYTKATHYCYGYRLEDYQKSSDDKEPSGTAGIPILSVLEKENIINIAVIVIRYFGGIKLGAGGLTRAYKKATTDALKLEDLVELTNGLELKLTFPYEELKKIDYILKDIEIINKEYDELITYNILIPQEKIELLKNYNYNIIRKVLIKK